MLSIYILSAVFLSRTCTSLPSNAQNNEEDIENTSVEASGSSMSVPQPTCSSVSNSSLLSNSGESGDLNSSRSMFLY